MTKKVGREGPPPMANYSDRSMDPYSTHEVKVDTEKRSTEDPDRIVPPEDRTHAYMVSPTATFTSRLILFMGPYSAILPRQPCPLP